MTLDRKHSTILLWWAIILHFVFFSFNALATSTFAALVGCKWDLLTNQERFQIIIAILSNYTAMLLVYLKSGMARLAAGKPPVSTGDTEQISRP